MTPVVVNQVPSTALAAVSMRTMFVVVKGAALHIVSAVMEMDVVPVDPIVVK